MKLLIPSPSPGHTDDHFSGLLSPPSFRPGFRQRTHRLTSQPMEMVDEDSAKVYVAVGKSLEKASALLQWCLKNFVDLEICILHVHQPSPYIPTLLGRLPASQANNEVVTAHRNEEWQVTRKLLTKYLNICARSKVQASVVTGESDHVHKGIMDLVAKYNTKKLVIGAVPDCVKLKKSSAKASYAAKMAPSLCEIWFINKGTLIYKKQSSNIQPQNQEQYITPSTNLLLSRSMPSYQGNNILFNPEYKRSNSARTASSRFEDRFLRVGTVSVDDVASSYTSINTRDGSDHITSPSTEYTSPWISSDSIGKNEEEMLYEQLEELMKEADRLKNEASNELLLRRKLDAEVVESIKEVKAFVSAHGHELELRKEAEESLRTTIQYKEKLIQETIETTHNFQEEMKSIAALDNRGHEANRRYNESAMKLNLIQESMANLQQENQKIQRQKIEATIWLDRMKNREVSGNIMEFYGEEERFNRFEEFSLSDLQGATCKFSESFKIGQGGYGVVYKGELLEKTVAIKRLHPHNIHRQSEFYQQAEILGRLRHPHLVTLIGVCPEAWSLVYDHIPNGSLQKRLFCNIPLNSKIRVRIIAEIASCLLFLHSLNQEEIVHGNLKPSNILLDSLNTSKVCDYGISRLIPPPDNNQIIRCPSFGRCSETRAFPYGDPEFFRTGILSTKSDIFAFGLIILQMVTGRNPDGLVGIVRKSVSCGKTGTIVDLSGGEWSMFVVRRLVDLGLHCCEMNGKDRPEITPMLVRELEQLYVLEDRPVPPFFLCPIFQEIMYDPQVASDGFTYEGEALRKWLENGGETSPMTNLKLIDPTLTPNHSLRLAIQEWVCNLHASSS